VHLNKVEEQLEIASIFTVSLRRRCAHNITSMYEVEMIKETERRSI
jgi:hypothetical protein